MKHDLFERVAVLNRHDISLKDITDLIPETIAGRAVECYAAGITDDIITDELIKFAPLIIKSGVANGRMVLDNQGMRTASQNATGLNNTSGKPDFEVRVKRVVATEESVHSHMWGVKSRPDVSVQVHAAPIIVQIIAAVVALVQIIWIFIPIVPLELKTKSILYASRADRFVYTSVC